MERRRQCLIVAITNDRDRRSTFTITLTYWVVCDPIDIAKTPLLARICVFFDLGNGADIRLDMALFNRAHRDGNPEHNEAQNSKQTG
ncbi:hypothetical protein STA1M1_30980 [Sinisalibacter aestuarii]|uniref:Uncharacterized protein n=1 Tax=Sinisalibacter aestuarii TaxID=2949426 RepID=A0ABQ5LWE1_9RHOB|nr:hypothetical protein STA1M1_30980 [Sinisalibacter aestuarii]